MFHRNSADSLASSLLTFARSPASSSCSAEHCSCICCCCCLALLTCACNSVDLHSSNNTHATQTGPSNDFETHACKHACVHSYVRTFACVHIRAHACTHTHTDACTCTHAHARMHMHAHACTHAHPGIHTYARMLVEGSDKNRRCRLVMWHTLMTLRFNPCVAVL